MTTGKTYNIPRLELTGSSYEIGLQHGQHLAPQILDQLAIYRALFREACKFDWAHVRTVAAEFQEGIARLAPDLLEEMRGIADGARAASGGGVWDAGDSEGNEAREVDVLDIVALNARSEIALGQWDDGCTSVAWRVRDAGGSGGERQILAQNWDWREAVGKNLAMASIAQEGKPKIWMVIEPGIVGKIGFNSHSVGVCLNAIRARPTSAALLPIHLLLRRALECASVPAAVAALEALGGAASAQHILIADAETGAQGLELSPRGAAYLSPDARGILVHTNHFLENRFADEPPWLKGSPVRLARAYELCGALADELALHEGAGEGARGVGVDAATLRARVFADTQGAPECICATPDPARGEARVQTLFNIVMAFAPGRAPAAEVVFGRPGSGEESGVFCMPW